MFKILKRHSYFFLTTFLAIAGFLTAGYLLLTNPMSGQTFSSMIIDQYSTTLFFIRVILYTILIGVWPVILNRIINTNTAIANRHRYISLLIIAIAIYEIMIVQRLPIRIFNLVSG